ncbi:hypothetical protein ElyMa_007028400 [Elysia marginata]|uniref:Uncharacterized protein n=1 Tax=Elysia marginata TaxID=1093978 RepID=A0AAV4JVW2_9GAST|nr:hypothetical protein ElyMa_007028400 [Elysia marginata]
MSSMSCAPSAIMLSTGEDIYFDNKTHTNCSANIYNNCNDKSTNVYDNCNNKSTNIYHNNSDSTNAYNNNSSNITNNCNYNVIITSNQCSRVKTDIRLIENAKLTTH